MNSLLRREIKGQVLVLVALALFVLVGFVALAVDGGNVFSTRRKMQNAADAGALAGARQLCFEDDTTFGAVEAVAQEYAITYNFADEADVTVSDEYTVTVVTRTTADTFFAGVIGFQEVDVAASASAMCSRAVEGDNIWPLAAEIDQFVDIDCDEDSGEGDLVYAFVKGANKNIQYFCAENLPAELPDVNKMHICQCGAADFTGPGGVTVAGHIGPGQRGWLALFLPPPPNTPEGMNNINCGSDEIGQWILNGHPGPITLGDCLPGNPGVKNASFIENNVNTIGAYPDLEDRIRNLVLYDRECEPCTTYDLPPSDHCCNSGNAQNYRVAGFGCVEVLEYRRNETIPGFAGYPDCVIDVILVRKRCGTECESGTGSGSGGIPDPDDVRAVRLID